MKLIINTHKFNLTFESKFMPHRGDVMTIHNEELDEDFQIQVMGIHYDSYHSGISSMPGKIETATLYCNILGDNDDTEN